MRTASSVIYLFFSWTADIEVLWNVHDIDVKVFRTETFRSKPLFISLYFAALSRKEESLLQFGSACRTQGVCLCLQSEESQTAQHEDGKICDVINTSFLNYVLNHWSCMFRVQHCPSSLSVIARIINLQTLCFPVRWSECDVWLCFWFLSCSCGSLVWLQPVGNTAWNILS